MVALIETKPTWSKGPQIILHDLLCTWVKFRQQGRGNHFEGSVCRAAKGMLGTELPLPPRMCRGSLAWVAVLGSETFTVTQSKFDGVR